MKTSRCGTADELDVRRGEQPGREERADDAHEDGAEAADDDILRRISCSRFLQARAMRMALSPESSRSSSKMPLRALVSLFGENIPFVKELFQSQSTPKMILMIP